MRHVFLIGHPVSHSVSPAMQNAALRASGLAWQYDLLETPRAQLPAVVERLRADDCAGANVTIPHKEAIIEFLDHVTPTARQIGAVNTIVQREGKLIGENTDGYGVIQTLREAQVQLRDARVVILGAGGAARAAVFALAAENVASIAIINRTAARARARRSGAATFSAPRALRQSHRNARGRAHRHQRHVGGNDAERQRFAAAAQRHLAARRCRFRYGVSSARDPTVARGAPRGRASTQRTGNVGASRRGSVRAVDGSRRAARVDVRNGAPRGGMLKWPNCSNVCASVAAPRRIPW